MNWVWTCQSTPRYIGKAPHCRVKPLCFPAPLEIEMQNVVVVHSVVPELLLLNSNPSKVVTYAWIGT